MQVRVIAAALLVVVAPVSAQDMIEGHTLDGATFSLPSVWVLGEDLPVTGTNWTTFAGDRGSVIGVKYDFGDVVPPVPLDVMDELWARIVVPDAGAFAVDLPFPRDAGWAEGETHTVHLLSGSLGDDDRARGPVLRLTIGAAGQN